MENPSNEIIYHPKKKSIAVQESDAREYLWKEKARFMENGGTSRQWNRMVQQQVGKEKSSDRIRKLTKQK